MIHNYQDFSFPQISLSCLPRSTIKLFHCPSPASYSFIFLSTFSKSAFRKGQLDTPCWMLLFSLFLWRWLSAPLGCTHRCCSFLCGTSCSPQKANCLSTERRHHLVQACFSERDNVSLPHAVGAIASCYFYHDH